MKSLSRFVGIGLAFAFTAAIVIAAMPGGTISKLVDNLPNNYLLFTGALGALGTLTMAVIQTIKDLVPVLRWFQEIKTRHWLSVRAAESAKVHANREVSPREIVKQRLVPQSSFARVAPELYLDLNPPFNETDKNNALEAEADLLRLATAGNRIAFYDLPIEQLCGQMNTASQAVLDYPERHVPLLKCLASLAEPDDIAAFAAQAPRLRQEQLRRTSPRTEPEEQELRRLQQLFADLRGPIANQIHRNIDAFQIDVGDRWKWYLRVASFLVSFGITAAALYAGFGAQWIDSSSTLNEWEAIVLIGLLGGFLAPVVSDIQAIVRQLRQST